jgi:ABC-type dipeptide/oligopeptide/nickel transport system permease subunit
MIGTAKDSMRANPLSIMAPGACITLFVIGASLVGDALRDALDPKQRAK